MKIFLVLTVFIISTFNSVAQPIKQKHVPSIVVNAFQLEFPKANEVDWELEKGYYKVEFKIDKTDCEAWLDYMGQVKKQKREMDRNELPRAVKAAIEKEFEGFEVHDAEWIEFKKQVVYKMKLEKGDKKRKVIFSKSGKVLDNKQN